MTAPDPVDVKHIACIGTGTIGGAWAVHFLRKGYDVSAWDPGPDSEARLRAMIEKVWPSMQTLGLSAGASPDRLRVTATLEEAVEAAEFVQESAPEQVETKAELLRRIDAATPGGAVIASSTSGYSMTDLQARCGHHPDRTVVGHPFHPVYLIPLVEVAPGEATACATVDWAMAFYDHAGKAAVRCRDRVHGFIANRLQAALIREAMHMVAENEASVADIDRSISQGPGLRWALMGPFLTVHLAGGEGGIADYFSKFPGDLSEPYTRLEGPEVDDALKSRVIEGMAPLTRGRTVAEIMTKRDQLLIELMKAIGDGL